MRLEFSRQILVKFSNVKLQENYSSVSRVVPVLTDRQTDGQIEERSDEANCRFVEIWRTRQKKLAHQFAPELASVAIMLEYSAGFAIYNAFCTRHLARSTLVQ